MFVGRGGGAAVVDDEDEEGDEEGIDEVVYCGGLLVGLLLDGEAQGQGEREAHIRVPARLGRVERICADH